MRFNISQELLEQLAQGEAQALLEGLNDETLSKNPAFLAKVRQFLKDNDVITSTEMEETQSLKDKVMNIPDLKSMLNMDEDSSGEV